jgi:hypothetical protein
MMRMHKKNLNSSLRDRLKTQQVKKTNHDLMVGRHQCTRDGPALVSVRMQRMLEKAPVDAVHAYCVSLTHCEESSEDCFCVDMC